MHFHIKLIFTAVLLVLSFESILAQQQSRQPQPTEDVLRVNTDLVQTSVTVVDSKGRFVDGLTKRDFALQVDGQPVPISFFENIIAGSPRDRLARPAAPTESAAAERSSPSVRRRAIVFFIDDRHLSLDSINRTRKMLLNFVDGRMGPNDFVAIASASGQIGFLQQFTDNREVLRTAVARLNQIPYVVTDYGQNPGAPMPEYMALTIERKDDPQAFEFYVQDCMKWSIQSPGSRGAIRAQCEVQVKNRARQLLMQAASVTGNTYSALDSLLHSAEKMPGSKLAFFISDGFLSDTGPRASIAPDHLLRITDEARRAGVVIYTIDARGLITWSLDATGNIPFDAVGMLENAGLRAIPASQDALNALGGDTGGRALRNQNSFDQFIDQALTETSRYYLIAWRPVSLDEKGQNPKFKNIEINVINHPELTVRSSRRFTNHVPSVAEAKAPRTENPKNAKKKDADADLQTALSDVFPKPALPLDLSLTYLDTPANGALLTTSVQAPADSLFYGEEGKSPAHLTIAGVVLNDEGKSAASFRTQLEIKPRAGGTEAEAPSKLIYNNPAALKPGIYQVRVAARDDAKGLVGSAMQWIVIPNLATHQLAVSSLLVGFDRVSAAGDERGQWSVDRKFPRDSRVKFLAFVYNAQSAPGTNLSGHVHVYQDGRAVLSKQISKAASIADLDPARVPFTSELDLKQLQPGAYVMEVTIEDLLAHKTASQQTTFYVE